MECDVRGEVEVSRGSRGLESSCTKFMLAFMPRYRESLSYYFSEMSSKDVPWCL